MACGIHCCILLGILLCPFTIRSQENYLKTQQFEDFKYAVYNEIVSLQNYLQGPAMVADVFQALQTKFQKIHDLSTEVQDLGTEVQKLTYVASIMETLNCSLGEITTNVEQLAALLNVSSPEKPLQTSLEMTGKKPHGLACAARHLVRYLNTSKSALEGIIVGTLTGVETIALPSLKKAQISSTATYAVYVAFHWNSRKVFWVHGKSRIKVSNLDGAHEQDLLQVDAYGLAVDSVSGSIYFRNHPSTNIRVCNRKVGKCSNLVRNQGQVHSLALHPSKRLLFWTNETSIVRANTDGTDVKVIVSESAGGGMNIDEDSDRIYWISEGHDYIASADFDGRDKKVLLKKWRLALQGIAVHGDIVYYDDRESNSVLSVSKFGGNPQIIARITGGILDIALYGSKRHSV